MAPKVDLYVSDRNEATTSLATFDHVTLTEGLPRVAAPVKEQKKLANDL